ncbi:hypothetical protein NPIL_562531 [Nephila pilipes]|uniref:Uncharacterized protein n=1 Tax=Nephila pilipes TaxID=299642 RepID=A0A8X6NI86_NEPPI|nr:hypothetical protein NPIL_562531 [Nephila pilipes]
MSKRIASCTVYAPSAASLAMDGRLLLSRDLETEVSLVAAERLHPKCLLTPDAYNVMSSANSPTKAPSSSQSRERNEQPLLSDYLLYSENSETAIGEWDMGKKKKSELFIICSGTRNLTFFGELIDD